MTDFPEITIIELINNGFDYVKNLEQFYLISENVTFDELAHYSPFILSKGFIINETNFIIGSKDMVKTLFVKENNENEFTINTLIDIQNINEIENHINQMELCAPRLHNRFNHLRKLLNLNIKS